MKAAYVDLHAGRKEQGASTLTMQLVRGLWLQPEKRRKRKLVEAMMTVYLEQKWSKEEIFETYANQVYLGEQVAYSIHGFAQGSPMFFGKELRNLTLPQAALLAGMVQRPSYFNPYRNPARTRDRRNRVLALMRANGYITEAEYGVGTGSPLNLAGPQHHEDSFGTPYFFDRVSDELQKIDQAEDGVKNIYTTIDLNLQRAALDAVNTGMAEVDKLLAKPYGKSDVRAEAALIALDPHTGEIKAMLGGRDYGRSQFNRILAKRPPGSVFKPFVYAAALDTAISGGDKIFTLASTVNDDPTSFLTDGESYQPANFRHELFGTLTLWQALAKSDNIAALKVAQDVGVRGGCDGAARRINQPDRRDTFCSIRFIRSDTFSKLPAPIQLSLTVESG
jgi:penicillin-binding protein 1B